ncbi:MAG: hypothetical protein EBU90_22225 [Proteobacteria bacterium]|nr:hypothetical protein [Pseudomonadota bacterium]NBP15610.1 hypothetical protein [bacterium]
MPGIAEAIIGAISGIFQAINNLFGHKNTKEMKERQVMQKETDFQNKLEKAIKEKDIETIRKLLSE